jgi:hypothetical protein
MASEEALIGLRVRVSEDLRSAQFRGEEGTIEKRWGNPDYVALDVLLAEGSSQLFRHYELEKIDANGA